MWSIFHGRVILPHISKTIWWMSVMFSDNETVWHKLWPQIKYRSTWPILKGLVILLNIFKIIWWRNIVFGVMDQCYTKIDLVKYMWVNDLSFTVHWFCLISCHNLFLYFKKWCRPGVFMPLRALCKFKWHWTSQSTYIYIYRNSRYHTTLAAKCVCYSQIA